MPVFLNAEARYPHVLLDGYVTRSNHSGCLFKLDRSQIQIPKQSLIIDSACLPAAGMVACSKSPQSCVLTGGSVQQLLPAPRLHPTLVPLNTICRISILQSANPHPLNKFQLPEPNQLPPGLKPPRSTGRGEDTGEGGRGESITSKPPLPQSTFTACTRPAGFALPIPPHMLPSNPPSRSVPDFTISGSKKQFRR